LESIFTVATMLPLLSVVTTAPLAMLAPGTTLPPMLILAITVSAVKPLPLTVMVWSATAVLGDSVRGAPTTSMFTVRAAASPTTTTLTCWVPKGVVVGTVTVTSALLVPPIVVPAGNAAPAPPNEIDVTTAFAGN
jgi:hypothetical protein